MDNSQQEWLTVSQFSDEMQVSVKVCYRWFAAGHASGMCPRFVRVGGGRLIRIRRSWFLEWIEEQADAAA